MTMEKTISKKTAVQGLKGKAHIVGASPGGNGNLLVWDADGILWKVDVRGNWSVVPDRRGE